MNPSCNKYGSYTSSKVVTSSLIDDARALSPTGPPWNLSIIAFKYRWSVSFNPNSSMLSLFKAILVIPLFILFSSSFAYCAKSRTRLKNLFAILGVPRLLLAISTAGIHKSSL